MSITLAVTAVIYFCISIIIISSSNAVSVGQGHFIRIMCSLNSNAPTIQWKSTHRQLTIPDDDLFVSVEMPAEKAEKPSLVLYIRKHTSKADVFVCSSNSQFWSFDGAEEVRQLSDVEIEQQYTAWIHLNLGTQPSSQPQSLTWSDRATIALNLLTNVPWFLVVILSLTILLHCLLLFAIFSVSEKFLQAAANFSRIAFIMTEGEKVRTLAKLKQQLGNN